MALATFNQESNISNFSVMLNLDTTFVYSFLKVKDVFQSLGILYKEYVRKQVLKTKA